MSRSGGDDADVIIAGGGHNGLVAAAYLADAGLRVLLVEARNELGGAVASSRPFAGVDVSVSRFSYLVSLLPDVIRTDLGLDLELRARRIASYTPALDAAGVLIDRTAADRTRAAFAARTGDDRAYAAWQRLHADLRGFAEVVAPTLTQPLPERADLAVRVSPQVWEGLVERPIGEWIERVLDDDLLRGTVLTDALIGTDSWAHDPTLRQNRCLCYHVIGNGTGEWRVPVGGMGAVSDSLVQAATSRGVQVRAGCAVTAVRPARDGVSVDLADGSRLDAPWLLAGCAPAALAALLGRPAHRPEGCQLKVNLVLRRLPRFSSAVPAEDGFAGTLHLHQGYRRLAAAYEESKAGRLPDPLPVEVYCHSLTDATIVGEPGWHTLTMFGLHTPARRFADDPEGARRRAGELALRSLQDYLAEPLDDCLARDRDGNPCVEVMSPLDIEAAVGMPGGHIFHGDLSWPWRPDAGDDASPLTPAERWGVATADDRILLCGAGAQRGGGVSGIGGHNAAMALLEAVG